MLQSFSPLKLLAAINLVVKFNMIGNNGVAPAFFTSVTFKATFVVALLGLSKNHVGENVNRRRIVAMFTRAVVVYSGLQSQTDGELALW